jgi:hypothetical protein
MGRERLNVDRWVFANLQLNRLGGGLAASAGDGEGVGGGFFRRNIKAARVRRPNLADGWIHGDSFGVGDVVAELGRFAGEDGDRRQVEGANGQLRAAEFLKGGKITGTALFRGSCGVAVRDGAIRVPAGEQNKGQIEGRGKGNNDRENKQSLQGSFWRLVGNVWQISHAEKITRKRWRGNREKAVGRDLAEAVPTVEVADVPEGYADQNHNAKFENENSKLPKIERTCGLGAQHAVLLQERSSDAGNRRRWKLGPSPKWVE